jgi:hypothetical protein
MTKNLREEFIILQNELAEELRIHSAFRKRQLSL